MEKPTKFSLMRNNREVAACRIYYERAVAVAPAEPAPAVPTMDVDGNGVLYREAPGLDAQGWHSCYGCAFERALDVRCERAGDLGAVAFGDRCGSRGVIYVKA